MNLSDGFRLGDWDVLPLEGRIVRPSDGESRRVRRKAMDVLCALASRNGQVAERDDLLGEVWGRAVSDEPLTSTVGELRRLLDEKAAGRQYIETIPKRGYRLTVAVEALADASSAPDDQAGDRQAAPVARLQPRARFDRRTAVAVVVVLALAVAAWWTLSDGGGPVAPDRSIAVLPFEDLSAAGDQGYFADGLAEELISLLTRLPAVRVAARNSAFAFRDDDLDAVQIGERLKVAHVLTGSVRRMGDQVRVTAQLVDARDGYQVWSESYERTLEDIFAIQDQIAGEVTAQLSVRLLGSAPRVRETEPEAYTLYLQARHIGRQNTADGLERAVALFREALAIDPDYAPAWTDLAIVYFNMVGIALMPREEGFALAREAAYRALAIEADFAPAHDRLGWLALHEANDLEAAAQHYRRALALAPWDDHVRSNAAVLAVALGRLDEAIALLEASVVFDPVSPISHANLANAYLLAGRYRAAERSIRSALALSPQYAGAHYRLGRMLLAQGDVEGARAAFEAEPLDAGRLLGLAMVANVEGDLAASDAALAEVKAAYGDRAAGNYAQVYAHRGDLDAAFDWLGVEYEVNAVSGFLEHRWDPIFESLREDPRWAELMQRIGFDDARLAAIEFPATEALAWRETPAG
jgi:TolB-like protein/DNA-binding winged helix-turn-helix (wHTH) protein/Flp pilus assembly protein TadD